MPAPDRFRASITALPPTRRVASERCTLTSYVALMARVERWTAPGTIADAAAASLVSGSTAGATAGSIGDAAGDGTALVGDAFIAGARSVGVGATAAGPSQAIVAVASRTSVTARRRLEVSGRSMRRIVASDADRGVDAWDPSLSANVLVPRGPSACPRRRGDRSERWMRAQRRRSARFEPKAFTAGDGCRSRCGAAQELARPSDTGGDGRRGAQPRRSGRWPRSAARDRGPAAGAAAADRSRRPRVVPAGRDRLSRGGPAAGRRAAHDHGRGRRARPVVRRARRPDRAPRRRVPGCPVAPRASRAP